ncbi:MAG: isoprenoid biosynthesis glyoxalase ElbB [Sphingomonadales bacterium]|nr:isoprenoid biosynthesis glyoxalase ElbB [Sphingomonadales bacterium]
MNFAVLLSGCGVYDGSEIHEAVLSLLCIEKAGHTYQCVAPDKCQYHVVNHLNGEVQEGEARNVRVEAARIARGKVLSTAEIDVDSFNFLLIPGGFGAAKNLNQWAILEAQGKVDESVQELIFAFYDARKPIAALCIAPTLLAQIFHSRGISATLTVGSDQFASPYDITGISNAIREIGCPVQMKAVPEIAVDRENRLVTAPCYMMETGISGVYENICNAINVLVSMGE